ncbi:GTP-binding protein [Sediminibacillus dalangtanensis]|uniref:GTP-binding protein n=1 Tax=Sediminibacillus dalangtanensis TaxID=2729421 RepID=A0ABX7VSX8_9BACI|nr:putative glycoside hydrolase [Sediminibacillus dalangtanensis]QTM98690.1 GTP-binding protein [Sediminibacillus dalangtanensis]
MGKRQLKTMIFAMLLLMLVSVPKVDAAEETKTMKTHHRSMSGVETYKVPERISRFSYNSGLNFEYPDHVRGIYVTGNSAGGERFDRLIKLINDTELNSMVIDVKEDHGNVTFKFEEDSPYADVGTNYIRSPEKMLKRLEEEGIYPIARIVVFKDPVLAKERPDLSFTQNGEVWVNGKGEAFVSPFQKEVWDYNIELAKQVAEMGFQEIQFDYVRFPEGFETRAEELEYDQGDYADLEMNGVKKRVKAVTDFVSHAKEELSDYDVDVSVDIFGYSATIEEAPGIGQNFSKIADNVDVISSMIYPSHWTSYFGIDNPDEEPYKLVTEYAKVENEVLGSLEDPPVSRPWIQDFEAPWLYSGKTKQYGKDEVEAQIKALNENGIHEFLIWNSGNSYTENVDYTPLDE